MSRRHGVYPALDMRRVFCCVNPGCLAKGRTFRAEREQTYLWDEGSGPLSVFAGYVPNAFNCPECLSPGEEIA